MKLKLYIISAFMMLSSMGFAQADNVLLTWVKFDRGGSYSLSNEAQLITIPATYSVDVYNYPDIYLELMNQRIDEKGYNEYLYISSLGDGYIVIEIQENVSGLPRSFTIRGMDGSTSVTINQGN